MQPAAWGSLPLGRSPVPSSSPLAREGSAAPLQARFWSRLACVTRLLWGGSNLTALSQAAAPPTGLCTRGRRAPGSWLRRHASSSPEPHHFAGARPPLLRDFEEPLPALGCPSAPRAEPQDPPQLQPLGLSCEIPALTLTLKSPKAPSPGSGPRPLLCIRPMGSRPVWLQWGSYPPPQ